MDSPAPSRIDFLDFMRIFAFFSVLIGHKFYAPLAAASQNPSLHVTLRYLAAASMPLFWAGGAGVVIFFMVSGYIITHVLRSEPTPVFLLKRAFRIYPLYIFAVLAQLAMNHAINGEALPAPSVWLPRILLIGDLFNTPYALGGVEWTLRIEIAFYLLMAAFNAAGLLRHTARLPLVFFLCTLMLQLAGPFPATGSFANGCFTLNFPFLFIGSLLYLAERRLADRSLCAATIAYILFSVLLLEPGISYVPNAKESNFYILALMVFVAAWRFRANMKANAVIRFASSLTYALYLFHDWLWNYVELLVARLGITCIPPGLQYIGCLLLCCAAAHYAIERPGQRLGQRVLRRLYPRGATAAAAGQGAAP